MPDFGNDHGVVLVVDDEPFIRNIFVKALSDYKVLEAEDGEAALLLVEKEKPRVVLLDIKMPKVDGLEVLRRIKEKNKDIAIIIVSAFGTNEITGKAMDLGAIGFITKPFRITKIQSMVASVFEE